MHFDFMSHVRTETDMIESGGNQIQVLEVKFPACRGAKK